jgi:enoyl-CoA hydratase
VVEYQVADGVATLFLNRPEARNALDSATATALLAAFDTAERDPAVRVILLSAADPVFCAGLDLKEFTRTGRPPDNASEVIAAAGHLEKPAIGALNGPVMTGGLELAMGLDILVASERASFADTHAKVGLLPGGGMTARLPRAVGLRRALEMSFTSDPIDALEAYRLGLVNRVVRHEELMDASMTLAATIASREPTVLKELKALYRYSAGHTLDEALTHEKDARRQARAEGKAASVTWPPSKSNSD